MQSQQENRALLLAGLAVIIVVLVALSGYYFGTRDARSNRLTSPTPSPVASVEPDAFPSESPTEFPVASPDSFPAVSPDTESEESVMCTMEAKQCPDGTFVGRSGPSCEFALCPGEVQTPVIQISP